MTVVKEDERGFYVLVGDRVGRPDPREYPKDLRAGQEVRAFSVGDGTVRVRYSGNTVFWDEYVGRREGGKPKGLFYEKGQVWVKRNGTGTKVTRVFTEGDGLGHYEEGWRCECTDGGKRTADGMLHKNGLSSVHDLIRLNAG